MKRFHLTIVALGIAVGVRAHHSGPPHYHMDQPQSLEGVVTEWRLVNPHAYVYFDVVDETGAAANWRCEMPAATGLRRLGWTADSLTPGQSITVNGAPARREDRVCYVNFLTLDDGTRIARNGPPGTAGGVAPTAGEPPAESRPAYLANGQPNLGGPWVSVGMGGGMGPGGMGPGPGGMGGGPPGLPAATEAGIAAAADYQQPFDDPAIFCHPANIIFGWTHDRHVNDIYQTDDAVTLQYGYMDLVRTIHLDLSEHPDNIVPGVGGHSIGWWEDDSLVVDTIGFEPGVLFPLNGRMHSAGMQVMERFEVADEGQTLVRSYTVHDPDFLQTDWVGESIMLRTSEPYVPYDCTELSGENNRRPAAE